MSVFKLFQSDCISQCMTLQDGLGTGAGVGGHIVFDPGQLIGHSGVHSRGIILQIETDEPNDFTYIHDMSSGLFLKFMYSGLKYGVSAYISDLTHPYFLLVKTLANQTTVSML